MKGIYINPDKIKNRSVTLDKLGFDVLEKEEAIYHALTDLNTREETNAYVAAQIIEEANEKYDNAYAWFSGVVSNAYTYYSSTLAQTYAYFVNMELITARAIQELDDRLTAYINGTSSQ